MLMCWSCRFFACYDPKTSLKIFHFPPKPLTSKKVRGTFPSWPSSSALKAMLSPVILRILRFFSSSFSRKIHENTWRPKKRSPNMTPLVIWWTFKRKYLVISSESIASMTMSYQNLVNLIDKLIPYNMHIVYTMARLQFKTFPEIELKHKAGSWIFYWISWSIVIEHCQKHKPGSLFLSSNGSYTEYR